MRNLDVVRERIARAAQRSGRPADAVRLVAVTKAVGLEEAMSLRDLGVTDFGENRIDAARTKIEALGRTVRWHMIGPVQRRKAKEVAALFDTADSVDRLEVAEALEQRCAEQDRRLSVLVEVNVSGEDSKHGFTSETAGPAIEEMARFEHLDVKGLMTMAPFVVDPEMTRPVFAGLRELAGLLGLSELSMGMTNDYQVAIEEGATQVRIGTALFD